MNWLKDNVNALGLLGAAVIIILTVFVVGKYIKQMKTDTATGELAEDNWDGIGEYKNPIPLGWALAFVGTMIWGLWYWFMGYPLNAYSQIGEYNEDVQAYTKNFEAQWQNPDNETLMGMGEGVFLVQCAPCHGITGDGINGYAQDFHTRMSKEQILDKINNGSKGLNYPMGEMPPGMASGKDAEDIAEWISGGMKGEKPASFAACASCHGEDGKGLGGQSPNLAEYDQTLTNKVLKHGRVGVIGTMPSFDDGRLTDVQKKAVGMYINSLLND